MRRHRSLISALLMLIGVVGIGYAVPPVLNQWALRDRVPGAGLVIGAARIIDGDTLEIGTTRIRLIGVDACERDQPAVDDTGQRYDCGAFATSMLRDNLQGRQVRCLLDGLDRYRRHLGQCFVEERDVAEGLLGRGAAIARSYQSHLSMLRYVIIEVQARVSGHGIWAGTFEDPAAWRARKAR